MADREHALRSVSPRLVLGVWFVVIALLAAVAGVLWWQDRGYDETEAARAEATAVVKQHLGAILSYRTASVEKDLAAAQRHLTGRFEEDFGQLARTVVAPASKQDGVTTEAKVVASSVVSASSTDVVALVYVSHTTKSKTLSEPKVTPSRLRVTLTRVGDRWLISELTPL